MSRKSTSYAAIPDDKKFYVLSNMIKSAVLFSYCPNAMHVLYMALAQYAAARARGDSALDHTGHLLLPFDAPPSPASSAVMCGTTAAFATWVCCTRFQISSPSSSSRACR